MVFIKWLIWGKVKKWFGRGTVFILVQWFIRLCWKNRQELKKIIIEKLEKRKV